MCRKVYSQVNMVTYNLYLIIPKPKLPLKRLSNILAYKANTFFKHMINQTKTTDKNQLQMEAASFI